MTAIAEAKAVQPRSRRAVFGTCDDCRRRVIGQWFEGFGPLTFDEAAATRGELITAVRGGHLVTVLDELRLGDEFVAWRKLLIVRRLELARALAGDGTVTRPHHVIHPHRRPMVLEPPRPLEPPPQRPPF